MTISGTTIFIFMCGVGYLLRKIAKQGERRDESNENQSQMTPYMRKMLRDKYKHIKIKPRKLKI